MWDTLQYAGASRRQPLHLSITTAGFDRNSVCWEQHEYARMVLDGTIQDPSFFALIIGADQEDDGTSPDVWRKANPSFGITIGNTTQLGSQLESDGFEMVAFGQGYASMNAPTKKLEEPVLGNKLSHGGHPVLRWMAGNVSIEKDAADNWKPSKKKSIEWIDGIVALIMGLAGATTREEDWGHWNPGLASR